jgi:hypothetical protein
MTDKTQPGADNALDLAKLTRYAPNDNSRHYADFPEGPMRVSLSGQYVKFADVEALIALARRAVLPGEAAGWTKERITELAKDIAVSVAKNASTVPQLTFPHIYLGLCDALLTATHPSEPAVPAVGGEPDNDGWTMVHKSAAVEIYSRAVGGEIVANAQQIEHAAKAIYEQLPTYQGGNATTHPWQPGGNSNKQDEARRYARAAIESLGAPAGALVANAEPHGWLQFIDGVKTQNFARTAEELEDIKRVFRLMKHTGKAEYVPVYAAPTGSAAAPAEQTQAARDVLAERRRQVEQEGWTPAHDDEYDEGELSLAAACYALQNDSVGSEPPELWPWPRKWWKASDERRNLVKAGALILADIERLDRATPIPTGNGDTEGEQA